MIDNYTYSVNTSYDNGQFTIVEKIGDGENNYTFKGIGATKEEAEKQIERQFKEALIKEINEAIAKTKKKPVEKPVEKKSCGESNPAFNKLKADYENLSKRYASLFSEPNSVLNKLKADYERLNKRYESLWDDYDNVCDQLEKLENIVGTPNESKRLENATAISSTDFNIDAMLEKHIQQCIDSLIASSRYFNAKE